MGYSISIDCYVLNLAVHQETFTKKGQPVWINTQKTTTKELLELDHNNEVQQLLIEQQNTRYKDR